MRPDGWVLYDGACGFCSKWIPFWQPSLEKRGLRVTPLQAAWVKERVPLLSEAELLEDIRVLLDDGAVLQGPHAYREMMRRMWFAFPLWVLSVLPGFRWLFDEAYRLFARHRYRFSEACRIPNVQPPR